MKHIKISIAFIVALISFNINAQWVQTSAGIAETGVFSITSRGNNLFSAGRSYDLTYVDGKIYKSTDNGANWVYTNQNGSIVSADNSNVYLGKTNQSSGGGIFRSTDDGSTWVLIGPPPQQCIRSLAVNGNYIYEGSMVCGQSNLFVFYMTTNAGASWNYVPMCCGSVKAISINGNYIFAGGLNMNKSTDFGLTWNSALSGASIYSIALNGNNIFAGTFTHGVYKSSDNGVTWSQTPLNNQYVRSITVTGNSVFAATDSNGVYLSTDNGASWIQKNEGLPAAPIPALFIFNNYIYAGTFGFKVYKRALSELIGITPVSNQVPEEFMLYQNYPNPFNPVTHLRFEIAELRFVKIIIYDLLGREVTTLVNEQLKPGIYEAQWDATNYPSGIYYYMLVSGDFSATKKMVLVK